MFLRKSAQLNASQVLCKNIFNHRLFKIQRLQDESTRKAKQAQAFLLYLLMGEFWIKELSYAYVTIKNAYYVCMENIQFGDMVITHG